MKIVTSKVMRDIDRAAIESHSIPSLELMERAGFKLADCAADFLKPGEGGVVVIAGRGNNGGDGLVAARSLISMGHDVSIILLAQTADLSPDARANFERLAPITTHIFMAADGKDVAPLAPMILESSLIVDAIFGTGLERDVKGAAARAIELINGARAPVISADVPSGLSADTGRAMPVAVRANATVTFGLPKKGLFIGRGPEFSGRIHVADIGIPHEVTDRANSDMELIEPAMFCSFFGKRDPKSHKGTYGHVVIFAGSMGHLGAGYLSSKAALRSGCGLVTYCLPQKAFARFDARYPEIMCDPIPDDGTARFHPSGLGEALKIAEGKSVAAIGPAIGTQKETKEFLNEFVKKAALPVVIDADGLNCLDLNSLKGRRHATILTPHPGEMAHLAGVSTTDIQSDRLGFATRYAVARKVYIVLKGHLTVVAAPDGSAAINPAGNAGMATAGMGDALTGIVASFLAQGMDPKSASMAGVYIHGLAGDLAAAEHGERALITSDVIGCLGSAMKFDSSLVR